MEASVRVTKGIGVPVRSVGSLCHCVPEGGREGVPIAGTKRIDELDMREELVDYQDQNLLRKTVSIRTQGEKLLTRSPCKQAVQAAIGCNYPLHVNVEHRLRHCSRQLIRHPALRGDAEVQVLPDVDLAWKLKVRQRSPL